MFRFRDRRGKRITPDVFLDLVGGDYAVVAVTSVTVGEATFRVGTAGTGLSVRDSTTGKRKAAMYATILEGGEGDKTGLGFDTLIEAIRGHDRIVAALKEGRLPEIDAESRLDQ